MASLQSPGLRPQACKLACMVKQTGGYKLSIKRKKQHYNLSNQLRNSPFIFIYCSMDNSHRGLLNNLGSPFLWVPPPPPKKITNCNPYILTAYDVYFDQLWFYIFLVIFHLKLRKTSVLSYSLKLVHTQMLVDSSRGNLNFVLFQKNEL